MKKLLIILLGLFTLIGCTTNKEDKVIDEPNTEKKEENEMFKNPVATITFKDLGAVTFELEINKAPQSVYNFTELANSGFYDGLTMHRLVKDFVAQGGDPDGTGMGGPGYGIKGEFYSNGVENDTGHNFGSLAFARSQMADSAGSQFYIVLSEYDANNRKRMDNDYAAFGTLLEGKEIIEKINNEYAPAGDGAPLQELIIESVTVDTLGQTIPAPEKLQ